MKLEIEIEDDIADRWADALDDLKRLLALPGIKMNASPEAALLLAGIESVEQALEFLHRNLNERW